ncbi:cysteine proteinase, partial [Thelephora ganbajun]
GAVNITRGDLERLQPGKYLNDTLIEFGLKLWLNDLRDCDPELADQIHLFSSFFYKKLAIKDKRAGYESVRKWTSRVDVFSKRYLVVPINEHLHWYLAIIYQPEYTTNQSQNGGRRTNSDGRNHQAGRAGNHTYIFVFDSLNGKHPGAMKNLVQYLRFEATDKKGIDNPSSPEAMAAHVPTQDNYCDCGLYLLHFAKVFMEDPVKSFNTILVGSLS